MAKAGKRMTAARAAFEGKEGLSVAEAVALVKENAKS
jgi:large subunit ribosomal protein L1